MDETQRTALAELALACSEADGCEVIVHEEDLALTRFTHNAIHQNVASVDVVVRFRAVENGRVGVAETNDVRPEKLRKAAARARAIAQLAPPDPNFPGLSAAPPSPQPVGAFSEATAKATADVRAELARDVFSVMEKHGLWAAGYISTARSGVTIANTSGTRASFDGTTAAINVKATGPDSTGYAEMLATDINDVRATDVAQRAADKAVASANPIGVEPGTWTVILEAPAFGELLSYLFGNFSAQSVSEGSSCFSLVTDRRYVSDEITLTEDAANSLAPGMPFDWEGVPTKQTLLIDRGRFSGPVTDETWAAKLQIPNTGNALPAPNPSGPQAMHAVLSPGSRSMRELIAGVKRGLLISRFWYIRPVDQKQTIVTGMTRDGTFLIEDGRITRGVRNLRFNESILNALSSCRPAAECRRTGGYSYELVAPAARIDSFRFTSTTEF